MKKRLVPGHHDDYENAFRNRGGTLLVRDYHQYPLYENGIFPLCLPSITYKKDELVPIIKECDGIAIFGGLDIDPVVYGEEVRHPVQRYEIRDQNEILVVTLALELGKPIFGICRGMQIINVTLGGTLYQDIGKEANTNVVHMQDRKDVTKFSHKISLEKNSFLYEILNKEETRVNSYHHQAIKTLGTGLQAVAKSHDGIIEAIQHDTLPIFGVERHPEFDYTHNEESRKIFSWLSTL